MSQTHIETLLKGLDSPNPETAWAEFLSEYATPIYQVIRHFEFDSDNAADCFQFICEQLIANRSRRLRKFKGEGTATFLTWLRAVVRNLCIDWHRKQVGRRRRFRSISRLSLFDQEVFQIVYERAIPFDQSLMILTAQFPNATAAQINESRARIEQVLTTNQRWLLSNRLKLGNGNYTTAVDERKEFVFDADAARPDPESQAIENERKRGLRRAMAKLDANERLLIGLRFEEGLTLDKTAELLGLGNAQRADRQIKEVLARLRKLISD